MTEKALKKLIKGYDTEAVLKKDSLTEFRIFLYSKKKRYPITNVITSTTLSKDTR